MTSKITKLPRRYRYKRTITKKEMNTVAVRDEMAWEVCPWLRSSLEELPKCFHCPRDEIIDEDEGNEAQHRGTRLCRLLADEACQVVLSMKEREVK